MRHKNIYRSLGLIFLFFMLTAQECNFWPIISFFLFIDPARPIDCNAFQITALTQHEDGTVFIRWRGDADEYILNVRFQGQTLASYSFSDNRLGDSYSFTIDWANLQGADEVTLELKQRLRGEYCALSTTVQRPVPAAVVSTMDCENLHLTSPLGGMANGFETFYWDALEGAVSYRINIYDNPGSSPLAGWDAGNLTSLQVDVSAAAIGGETPLVVELVATDAAGNACTQGYEIAREAVPAQEAPPTSTPTCAEDPRRNGC